MKKLLSKIRVIDTETTFTEIEVAELVEIGMAVWNFNIDNWQTNSSLFDSWIPIPAEASAVNNISRHLLAGRPKFSESIPVANNLLGFNEMPIWVAHNAKFDRDILVNNYKKLNMLEQATQLSNTDNWICTLRLAKQLLIPDFPITTFSLNYFRYFFDLPVENRALHRADVDCLVCGEFLKLLVSYGLESGKLDPNIDIAEQLVALSNAPITIATWPFGKYRGTNLVDIPTDYYMWAMKNMDALNDELPNYDADLAASVADVLVKRERL